MVLMIILRMFADGNKLYINWQTFFAFLDFNFLYVKDHSWDYKDFVFQYFWRYLSVMVHVDEYRNQFQFDF